MAFDTEFFLHLQQFLACEKSRRDKHFRAADKLAAKNKFVRAKSRSEENAALRSAQTIQDYVSGWPTWRIEEFKRIRARLNKGK